MWRERAADFIRPANLVSFMKSQQNLSRGRDYKPGLNNTAGRLVFSLLARSPLCCDECLIHSKASFLLHNKSHCDCSSLYELSVGPHSLLWRGHISEMSQQCLNEDSMISPWLIDPVSVPKKPSPILWQADRQSSDLWAQLRPETGDDLSSTLGSWAG